MISHLFSIGLFRDLHYVLVFNVHGIRQFLEEATAFDPRFKSKVADEVWIRLEDELMKRNSESV